MKPETNVVYTREQQAENRRKWVAALRSGKYKQCFGTLTYQTTPSHKLFCAMGVACDISGLGEWDGSSYLGYCTNTPDKVTAWLGLPRLAPQVVKMNDIFRLSFEEIAGMVENGEIETV